MTDDKLMQILHSGNKEDFFFIMEEYNKLLWVVVSGILNGVGTNEDIEECISDAYVNLWKNPTAYDPQKGSLKTFITTIAKHKALDRYRQLAKTKHIEINEAISATADDLLEPLINHDLYGNLHEAIHDLKEPDKEIVIRRYFFNEMPARIASKISIPVKEVKNRLYQSKLRLKKALEVKETTGNG